MRTIKDIKSVKDNLIKDIKLQYKGNTLMCIKKTTYKGISVYTNDTVSQRHSKIRDIKLFCLDYFKPLMCKIDKQHKKGK